MNEIKTGINIVDRMFMGFRKKIAPVKTWTAEKSCDKHGSFSALFYLYDNGDISSDDCPICSQERMVEEQKKMDQEEKAEQEREAREAEQRRINRLKVRNVSPEFWNKTLADYIPKTNGQKIAKEAVENLIETQQGKIIILGSNGTGKTMLSSMAVKELGGYIYTMYEISTMIRQSYTAKADRSELEIVEDLAQAPFLAIDEVGRVKNSEAVRDWFSYIIDKRHTSGKPTMLTGNLHFLKQCKNGGCEQCFERYFDSDIVSRLQQDTTIIYIKAEDNRRDNSAKIGGDL